MKIDTVALPDQNTLRKEYEKLLSELTSIGQDLELCIKEAISVMSPVPAVKGRVKSFESYFKKYIRLLKSGLGGGSPQISDLIGVRIICLFPEDLCVVEKLIHEKFRVIEVENKGRDHSFREFGYESIHLLIDIPENIIQKNNSHSKTAEIQIRTILQDAWAEVEHELIYKAQFTPFDAPLKRKLAAVNASLSLADTIFQEIRNYQQALNGELGKRRDSFFRKIEDSTDAILFSDEKPQTKEESSFIEKKEKNGEPLFSSSPASIDELLLKALSAHNKKQFSEAITIYTQILDMKPDVMVSSLIYKHRGMAYFARSHYSEAITDFSESLKLDPKSYKAAYYEGVVCSVLQLYLQAVEAFNKSLEINPYQPYCLFRRGQAYFHLEDFPQALGDCEKALALESFEAARKFRDLLLDKLKM